MKRTIILAVLVMLFGAATVKAQEDKQLFNHLAAGAALGIDGTGIHVATPVTPYMQLRGGYAFTLPGTGTGSFGQHTMDNGHTANLEDMPITVWVFKGGLGELFLDVFPWKTSPFRITGGVLVGGGKFLSVKGDMRECMLPEDYATPMTRGDVVFSTDADGYGYGDALSWKALPYVGLGTGRAVNLVDKKLRFTFDAGVAFPGGLKIQTYGFSSGSKVPYEVTSATTVNEEGENEDGGLIDFLSGTSVLPFIKFGLFYTIF